MSHERNLGTVANSAELALPSPARVAGMIDVPSAELDRYLDPVRLGHRTMRYRLSDFQSLIARHQGASGPGPPA